MDPAARSSLDLMKKQRSHVLFCLCDPVAGSENAFRHWYQGSCLEALSNTESVLGARHFVQDEVDITRGRYERLPFRYLGMYELSLDGAEESSPFIDRIHAIFREQSFSQPPVTWLYYPISEKVGRTSRGLPSMLTLAFANGVPGQEEEFREWYATRHIRHALNIAALVSGQCFQRALFQKPGARDAAFSIIAVYEQEGSAESIVKSFLSLPPETFRFPMMDRAPGRFAEWSYRSLT